jgi:excisionase family DNA binding protein
MPQDNNRLDVRDPDSWPLRLYRTEVCQLARVSRDKLRAMIRDGQMPQPVMRGREDLFDREQVAVALGARKEQAQAEAAADAWSRGLEAVHGGR